MADTTHPEHPECGIPEMDLQALQKPFDSESDSGRLLKELELPPWSRTISGGRAFWLLYASGATASIVTVDQWSQLRITNTMRDLLGSSGQFIIGQCISNHTEASVRVDDCGKPHFSACAACMQKNDLCIVCVPTGFVVMPRSTKEKDKWSP